MPDRFRTIAKLVSAGIKHPEITANLLTRGDTPFATSIDIAANCNLRCQHCYLFGKEHQEEGINGDDAFLNKVREFRKQNPSIVQCTWVGGEPMFRKELLRKAVTFFPFNWVVTNGTIPIDGEWKNTSFWISIDGTEEAHNKIRQPWKQSGNAKPLYNVYKRAKVIAKNATAPVFVHTVINKTNVGTIPDLVKEWETNGNVGGFKFSLHTPMIEPTKESGMTENDEKLFIGGQERLEAVKMLRTLKKIHGDFVLMSEAEIDSFLPENQKKVFDSNCRVVKGVSSVDSKFNPKKPCVMGEGMDCGKCGCVIPAMVDRFAKLDPQAIRMVLKTLSPQKR